MGVRILNVRYHDFIPVKQFNNVVLAKCRCCQMPRYAVYKIENSARIFIYHGYDRQYAEKLSNSLVSRSQIQS